MFYIPSSPAEVKGIFETVNLTTFDRFKYLKGESQICPFPLDLIPEKVKDLATLLDEQIWDHADPDHEVAFLWPPEVQPWDSQPSKDGFLFFERKPKWGEVTDDKLAFFKARAAERANPRPDLYEEELRPPLRRDNVIDLPDAKRRPVRHDRPPRDVVKYIRKTGHRGEWQKVLLQLYISSEYLQKKNVPGYHGTSEQAGRFYYLGLVWLAKETGLKEWTVQRQMAWLKGECFIHECKRGNKERGCSVWELPLNMAHVKAWRRKHKDGLIRSGPKPGKTSDGQGRLERPITRAARAILGKLFGQKEKPA